MIIIIELYNTRGVIEIMGRIIMKNESILLVLMLLIPLFFSAFQAASIEIIETNKKKNIS